MKINNPALIKILDNILNSQGRKLNDVEQEMLRNYKRALDEIRGQIAELYMNHADEIAAKEFSVGRLKELTTALKQKVAQLYLKDSTLIHTNLRSVYSENYYGVEEGLVAGTGVNFSFGLVNEDQVKAAVENDYSKIKWMDSEKSNIAKLNGDLKTEVEQHIIQGKSIAKTTAVVTDKLDIGANRALRIVRTETHRVQNLGRLDGYDSAMKDAKELGIQLQKKWISISDNRTRPDHIIMNNQIANDKGMFTLPIGKETAAPGLSGYASEDINCRCHMILEIIPT